MNQAEQMREAVAIHFDTLAKGRETAGDAQAAAALRRMAADVRALPLPPPEPVSGRVVREAAAVLADEEARRLRNGGAIKALRKVAAAIRALPLPPPSDDRRAG